MTANLKIIFSVTLVFYLNTSTGQTAHKDTNVFHRVSYIGGPDTLKICGKYKGVNISFNPWDKSYILHDTISVFVTSIEKVLVNDIEYSRPETYPWTIELSKLGFKKNDKVTVLLICREKHTFKINLPKGFKIKNNSKDNIKDEKIK